MSDEATNEQAQAVPQSPEPAHGGDEAIGAAAVDLVTAGGVAAPDGKWDDDGGAVATETMTPAGGVVDAVEAAIDVAEGAGANLEVSTPAPAMRETVEGTVQQDDGAVQQSTGLPMRRVIVDLPDVRSSGYAATSFAISLTGERARTLANVLEGLQNRGENVTSAAGAIGWLLDQIGAGA